MEDLEGEIEGGLSMRIMHCYANLGRLELGVMEFVEEHINEIELRSTKHSIHLLDGSIHTFVVVPLSTCLDVFEDFVGEIDIHDVRCWMIELRKQLEEIRIKAQAREDIIHEEMKA